MEVYSLISQKKKKNKKKKINNFFFFFKFNLNNKHFYEYKLSIYS